ncbi:hypothetical protein EHI8A_174650 [Entamoeba histolytica HM-1:IMSS-B]|uniref:UBX domain-containing protein n=6 Tax=Entamoeba histolytica TaxID=5759 RepID=C4M8M1_ENTH1|nr:hypothetical protein EHI_114380 [Entamoeba histolytica HM-1:IMSS]EMD44823.1 Hypothetical protein EHI5A_064310 [Entamoeba histolytica KU27]EMH77031.1 hypothetical protein EHI8A_174650 [Entamoeba histolytica HM-1:IMSS-B]EMS15943.1 hypothetical protein KM1_249160 [Entamoeba histolytica HM-3:IMSS]ENY65287.1 hypothetical protein EHI7A_154860 [Entamoeba histolytica HM-1:IMSS-A]GAT97964.1 hypothetical protein CL6EHI_114380 [Entamoeba histolytica]|eukprot:XP_649731.1 hypothetical protein EHI_114380 [Entamoeba histolytica HM-1:IMSS]
MNLPTKVQQFIELTGAPEEYAKLYLDNCNGNLETSVNAYLENEEIALKGDENYLAPEKIKITQLMTPTSTESNTFMFRNFKDEAEGKITNYQQFVPLSESSVLGDFGAACERAEKENKWILAYVFKENDLECLTFIRDVWKSSSVRWQMARNYILWVPLTAIANNYSTSTTGLSSIKTCDDYVTRYKIKMPSIALHNPITGELLELITARDEKELSLKLKDIIRVYEYPNKDEIKRKTDNICEISSDSSSEDNSDLICFGANKKPSQLKNDTTTSKTTNIIEIDDSLLSESTKTSLKKSQDIVDSFNQNNPQLKIQQPTQEVKPCIHKVSVYNKPKEGKQGKIKITLNKQTKIIEIYENYTVGDVLEIIRNEFNEKNLIIWGNLPRRRIDLMDENTLLTEVKLYPSSVLIVEQIK